jgi:hypothetical protein
MIVVLCHILLDIVLLDEQGREQFRTRDVLSCSVAFCVFQIAQVGMA